MENSTSISRLAALDELLRMEQNYETAAYARLLRDGLDAGRANNADCKYPITINGWGYNALNHLIVTVSYETDVEEIENNFEPGTSVTFFFLNERSLDLDNGGFAGNEGIVELPYSCSVESYKEGVLQIQVPSQKALDELQSRSGRSLLGVRVAVDNASYRVMHRALNVVMNPKNEKLVNLRETLIGTQKPRFRNLPPISFPWLNDTQNCAVRQVVAAMDVAVVHGPPGTGKTTTLIEAIIETLQRETQVLVCAPSNAAVDWISEQLSKRCVNVLRIGNPLRMSDEMLECSYERRYGDHPDYPELLQIRQFFRNCEKPPRREIGVKLSKRAHELEYKIDNDLFRQARVVSCTLIGSAYHVLDHRHFGTLFIDEAAQALEPACWAAILKADRVVLSGDHQQLPPTVKCVEAARKGLSNTLMQYVVRTKPECVTLLTTQYRMNRDIMSFSSRWFYHGALKAAPEVADRLVHLMDTPLTWIDTCGGERKTESGERKAESGERRTKSGSLSNADEARLVVHTLRNYVEMIGLERIVDDAIDIGIISPYRGQVRMIRRLLKMQHFYRRLGGQVTVRTVDGFQGQERDVIIISMVRDNERGEIGFLSDLRRMNVAITRARMKLIVIGNSETLSRNRFYKSLYEYFCERGEVVVLEPEEEASNSAQNETAGSS